MSCEETSNLEKKLCIIGILVYLQENPDASTKLNSILSQNSNIIVARMGFPYKERGVSVLSLIADGTLDEINNLTGKIGKIKGVTVKTAIAKELGNKKN